VPPTDDTLIQEQRRLEHLKEMSAYAAEDSRVVYLRVTASLALGLLFLTQLPFARLTRLPVEFRLFLLAGLLALAASAILFFEYSIKAHNARREVAKRILVGTESSVVDWWDSTGPWKTHLWAFHGGNALFAIGAALLGLVLAKLLNVI
jgi:hypothetical protein